jgi:integrase
MIRPYPVTDLGKAIDIYLGELARRSCTEETLRTYRRILNLFADRFEAKLLEEITVTDCRSFLNRWSSASAATQAQYVSILRGFFAFLVDEGAIAETPMARIKRPRRLPPEDTDVVSISTTDARRILEACEDWQEVLCVATALYLGARRGALSKVRRRDLDLDAGTVRFLEKGSKVAVKPIPDEYLAVLRAADDDGIWLSPENYLIRPVAQRPYAAANAPTRSSGRRSVGLRRGWGSGLTSTLSALPSRCSSLTCTPAKHWHSKT